MGTRDLGRNAHDLARRATPTPIGTIATMKRRVPVGAAARRRIAAGGPLAKGRKAETLAGWRALKLRVFERDNFRCMWCDSPRDLDAHHVLARSHGGPDVPENIVTLCRRDHDRVGQGTLRVEIVTEGEGGFRLTSRGPSA